MRTLALAVLALAACQPRTEILLGIATDYEAPTGIDEVQLEVSRGGTGVPQQSLSWQLPGIPYEQYILPGSFGIVSDDSLPIDVKLIGLKGGTEVVTREAKLTLVDGQTLFYRMGLTQACEGMTCTGGQTCVEGVCEGKEIDPDFLPEYIPELVTTLTCESLVQYINTGNGEPMPYSEDAADCPYILCAEGTCLDLPEGAQLFRGVCNAVSSFALLIDGEKAGASIGYFRGLDGTASANDFTIPIPINTGTQTEIVTFTGSFQGSRAYALGISDAGSIRCDAYTGTPRRFCGTFTRTIIPTSGANIEQTGRVAFVREGDVLFGQYDDDATAEGSFDGWPATDEGATGESFRMFWRNEARSGIRIESGVARASLAADYLSGSWEGTTPYGANDTAIIRGTFEADPSRCRAVTNNCSERCGFGELCVKGTCIGTGQLRFTLEWDTATDIDLHVKTPAGDVISWMNRTAGDGTLDVDDQGGGRLIENIYFTAPAPGVYEVWANNYDGDTAATYTITVATPSMTVSTFTGSLAAAHVESTHHTITR